MNAVVLMAASTGAQQIAGILAEHRWKHLVQIGQLLPS